MVRRVRSLVTPEPLDVVDASLSIQDCSDRMRAGGVHELLVVDGDRFLGLLSDSAIALSALTGDTHPAEVRAGDVCDRDCPRVSPDESVRRALTVMRHHGVRRLPVVQRGELLGTVWLSDLSVGTRPRPQVGVRAG